MYVIYFFAWLITIYCLYQQSHTINTQLQLHNKLIINYIYLHIDLGITFLEINNRAYVRTVTPNSSADIAGIQPQDCVQFAFVVGGSQFKHVHVNSTNNTADSSNIKGNNKESEEEEEKRRKRGVE